MPDISMCLDHNCPSKNICYRYFAKPDEFQQSYNDFGRKRGQSKCDMYYDNGEVNLEPSEPDMEGGEFMEITDPSDEFLITEN